jgi:hypothetical protein
MGGLVRFPDRSTAFICRMSTRRRADCSFFECRFEHVALCDAVVGARGGTCNRKMCEDHRTRVGDDLDHCPATCTL